MSKSNLSYHQLSNERLKQLNGLLSKKDAMDILKWAYEEFNDDLIYACSFGAEGIVLTDMISKIRPDAKIIFLDTNVHFKETYELIEKMKEKYPSLQIKRIEPQLSLDAQHHQYGKDLWKSNPDLCCKLRKLEPLANVLSNFNAWISGLRREQSPARAAVQFVNKDHKFSSIKICPLIHWTWVDVWNYISLFQLPYNELHDQGYPSIGCKHCTVAVDSNSDFRAGRWSGFAKTECGLHLQKKP
ncbi:phosphoadenylyl-sulfate reductase [Fictibacillus gelatini]|uniref:phosphoadenylyl-sulfate reductase n=1 Tax=Fictibacillus gelatini TaxID=225985 RepID=UPI00040B521C|nr:phosphoadenylyl-sulfate reductase [Fictibacillus gelatini]